MKQHTARPMKVQSVSDIITNSSSEVFIVRPGEDLFSPLDLTPTPERIKQAIRDHAAKYRLPYAEWYVKENPMAVSGYNTTSQDPDGYIQYITLFDAFRQYVLHTFQHGTTPELSNRTSKPWNHITVDEVIEALKENAEFNGINQHLDDDSVLVEIDRKMGVTEKYMFDNFNLTYYTTPLWLDFLTQALIECEEQREETDPRRKKVFEWCDREFKRWREEHKLKNVKKPE